MNIGKITGKHQDKLYLVFRVLVGFLFLQHGGQKLFGWFGGNVASLTSLMGVAGIIEFFGGLAILLGLFSRLAALIAGLEMLTAFFMAHYPNGLNPLLNGGELALMFFASFLIVIVHGNRKWSLEKKILNKETF